MQSHSGASDDRHSVPSELFDPSSADGFPLRPFASRTATDVRVESPSTEPLDPDRMLARAQEAASQDRRADAEALFREILSLEPASTQASIGLARLLEGGLDAAGGISVLSAALKVQPDQADLLLARAGMQRRRKELAEAEVDARRVLKLQPHHPDGLFELGLVLLRKGQPAEAGQVLMRRVEQRPDDGETWYYIGEARNQAGNLPAALEALRRAASLDERDGKTFYLMGRVLDRMGKPDEAMPMYRRSRELSA